MALINPSELKDSYDVIVVGSGAGGGQSAYTLTMEGASVLMIEAGRNYDPVRETAMFQTNADAPLRGVGTPDKPRGFHDATVDGGWQVPGEPYTNASSKPEEQFMWWRSRMLGGRTNHWGRISLRNGPYDFKPRSRDGLGFDWPLAYEDIAPYYDKVEMLVGVYGDSEGIENSPDSPPGVLLPPPKPRAGEQLARKHAQSLGIPVVPVHRAVLSTRLNDRNVPVKLHAQLPSDPRQSRKNAGRRPKRPPIQAPARQPMIEPTAVSVCTKAFARGSVGPAIWSAHRGSHCTEPHEPIKATLAKSDPIKVRRSRGRESIS